MRSFLFRFRKNVCCDLPTRKNFVAFRDPGDATRAHTEPDSLYWFPLAHQRERDTVDRCQCDSAHQRHCTICTLCSTMSLYLLWRCIWYNKKKGWIQGHNYGRRRGYSALCAVRKVYFSAQKKKLRPILKFEKYYPIKHIFVPACLSARKIHFFSFSDFQTLDPWFPPKYVTVSTPSSVITAQYPPLILIVSDTAS